MKHLYHATKNKNFYDIYDEGLKPGWDGLIYFCTEKEHAVNWIAMSCSKGEEIACFRVRVSDLDQEKIKDGYDHDPNYFKGVTVKTYSENISPDSLEDDEGLDIWGEVYTVL
ncbi:hypothetical protein [Pseudalkalibacillus decolorationis]|uniref:hypothetical protein n=1 Tax=Pseudalkalibacillus decolorationis TaxID=163879 RepID=UPI002148DB1C|nr:hypothetical protein [Pseudalkalibacillus decolorationis]